MIIINMQYFGNKGASSGKSSGGGAGASAQAQEKGTKSLTQNEFYRTLTMAKFSEEETAKTAIRSAITDVETGAVITVDNRLISGFRSTTQGTAYDFRKVGQNEWEEVFGEHENVSNRQIYNMYINSRGYQRGRR